MLLAVLQLQAHTEVCVSQCIRLLKVGGSEELTESRVRASLLPLTASSHAPARLTASCAKAALGGNSLECLMSAQKWCFTLFTARPCAVGALSQLLSLRLQLGLVYSSSRGSRVDGCGAQAHWQLAKRHQGRAGQGGPWAQRGMKADRRGAGRGWREE